MALSLAGRAFWAGIDLVLPPRCPACGVIVGREHSLCQDCWAELEFITPPVCAVCGVPFVFDRGEAAICGACLADPPRYASARAAVVYGGSAKPVVLGFKHSDKPYLARLMAGHMVRVAGDLLDPGRAVIVPVPLHRWRIWSRGYNQAALLAQALGRRSGVPVALEALVRRRNTRKSGGMNREQRYANVRAAIAPGPEAARVRGCRVLLVDDVLTTGATANACSAALLKAGADDVHLLTWARVVRDEAGGHI